MDRRCSANDLEHQSGHISFSKYSEKVLENIFVFRHQNLFCDAVLLVDTKRIPVHRVVLASASKYFENLFKEARSKVPPQDTFTTDIDGDTFQAIVNFCYTGKIELNENNVGNIRAAATVFQIKLLKEACTEFLQNQLSSNACSITKTITELDDFITSEQKYEDNAIKNFMNVYKESKFLRSSFERISTIIKSDDLNVPVEDFVFDAVRQWLLFDKNNQIHMNEILNLVRFPLITKEYLFDEVSPFCESFLKSTTLIMDTLRLHLLPMSRPKILPESTIPRKSEARIFAVGSWQAQTSSEIEVYDPWTNTWSSYANMNIKKINYGATIVEDKLFIVGGYETTSLTSVDMFDLNSGVLSKMPPMRERRSNPGVVIMKEDTKTMLYAIGGWDDSTSSRTVEKLDLEINRWSYMPSMNQIRDSFGVTTFKGKIYVAGGRSGDIYLNSVESFDPVRNMWKNESPLTVQRNCCSLVEAGGYLYAVGGYRGAYGGRALFSIERYDPIVGIWTVVENLPYTKGAVGVGLLGNHLISIGGGTSSPRICLENVDLYDLENKKWKSGKSLRTARDGARVLAVPWNLLNNKVLCNLNLKNV